MGHRRRFWRGAGGVIVVIVIHVCSPHVVKETPGIVIVRMGEDDRPSPTTTRHVLPLWRLGADDENDGTVVPLQGSEFFKDVKGDYHDGLQNEVARITLPRAPPSSPMPRQGRSPIGRSEDSSGMSTAPKGTRVHTCGGKGTC